MAKSKSHVYKSLLKSKSKYICMDIFEYTTACALKGFVSVYFVHAQKMYMQTEKKYIHLPFVYKYVKGE